jgi:hypothetical protein
MPDQPHARRGGAVDQMQQLLGHAAPVAADRMPAVVPVTFDCARLVAGGAQSFQHPAVSAGAEAVRMRENEHLSYSVG